VVRGSRSQAQHIIEPMTVASTLLSWSSGKDSAFALAELRMQDSDGSLTSTANAFTHEHSEVASSAAQGSAGASRAHDRAEAASRRGQFVFKMMVPRDRIELPTPGFSVAQTDVRVRPQGSTLVFTYDFKTSVASAIVHQHPGTKVSAKVSFAMGSQAPERPLETPIIECATALVTARWGVRGSVLLADSVRRISRAVESAHSVVRRDVAAACERHPAGKR
jgi:hypothetical protein